MPATDWNPALESPWLSVHWHPSRSATGARSVSLHHPLHPFVRPCAPNPGHADLIRVAWAYLDTVLPLLEPHSSTQWAKWMRQLDPDALAPPLDEVACAWLDATAEEPRGSRAVRRSVPGAARERTEVLSAGLSLHGPGGLRPFYGGQGVSVAVEIGSGEARIRGMTCTLPNIEKPYGSAALSEAVQDLDPVFLAAFGLPPTARMRELALRLIGGGYVEVHVSVAREPDPADRTGHLRGAEYLVGRLGGESGLRNSFKAVSRTALAAFGLPQEDLDPVSRSRDEPPLARFEKLRPHRMALRGVAGRDALKLAPGKRLENSYVRVVDSPWSVRERPSGAAPEVDPVVDAAQAHDQGDTLAAHAAFRHVNGLFERMQRYGLDPEAQLPFVAFPIDVEYRAGITPGPGRDGRTVNAQVLWVPPEGRCALPDLLGTCGGASLRWPLHMRFARAETRASRGDGALGVATDVRWVWHELSHVLLAGALGELEFRFAHGAGDGLGAILCDPESGLAREPGWRGLTFPWVYLPRRHDRSVTEGWGWSGSRYLRDRIYVAPHLCDKRTYWTEQIMSSTLFHLYRLLGGDAMRRDGETVVPDVAARHFAADYAVYLVIRAIVSLPADAVVSADSAEDFAQALERADLETARFELDGRSRLGGAACKLVRYAFEQQGLRDPDAGTPIDAPATPLCEDLYADDGRGGEYCLEDGLDERAWMRSGALALGEPAVLALRGATVGVRFGNRGARAASDATVRVWAAPCAADGALPPWPDAGWRQVGAATLAAAAGAAGLEAAVDCAFGGSRGAHVLLAELSDTGDRAVIDPAAAAACGRAGMPGMPLALLLAGDNNLAAARVEIR